MSQTVLNPEILDSNSIGSGRWMTVIFNNDTNGMDEVMLTIMQATGCDAEEAYCEMWEAHTYGKAPVHFASRAECEEVAKIISRIGVATEVTLEWQEAST